MKVVTCIITVFFCCSILTGCGTLVRGSKETYRVISEPSGAIAVFSSGEVCITPCEVEKKRNEPFFMRIVKDGYNPYDIQVEDKPCKGRGATMVANLFMIGSVIWESIDRMIGANKELTPNPAMASLVPSGNQPVSYVLLSAQVPGLQKSILSPEKTYP